MQHLMPIYNMLSVQTHRRPFYAVSGIQRITTEGFSLF